MTGDSLIIDNLVVRRAGREVLHGISLTLNRGEIAGLLGANGAGKSTLVMTIAGTLPTESGDVTLGGSSLLGLSRTPRDAGAFRSLPRDTGFLALYRLWTICAPQGRT